MFSGSWKESSMNIIELEIPDQNIDVEGNDHHNYYHYAKSLKHNLFILLVESKYFLLTL